MVERGYNDLREHIAVLRERGLLWEIDDAVDKDAEMQPLVRWQYRGGVAESDRRAFLFTHVVDGSGRRYGNSVLIAGLAGTPEVYAAGLQCKGEDVGARWDEAFAKPIPPVMVDEGPVQEVVLGPEDFAQEGGGFGSIPMPISTPGFDNAPYLTSAHAITKDPDTGVRNVGHYRGQVKSPTTCGVFFTGSYKHGYMHWEKARARGEHLECAFVIGAEPVVSYAAVQQVPYGVDEYDVAGGLAREPIRLVKCRTVDLEVPAHAEIVLEGYIGTDYLEPEGPFGESHGYVQTRTESPVFHLTAITHRRGYVWTSFISQVTPSESSVIKKVGFEPMLAGFLRDTLGVDGVKRVVMHEPLTNLRRVIFVQFAHGVRQTEVWRALKGVAAYRAEIGKIVVAVDDDIDPDSLDAVWWAMAYRSRPHLDVQVIRGQYKGHGPPFTDDAELLEDSNLLVNATLKYDLPPVSLPKREYMERARVLWERIGEKYGLPAITPEAPWHGYVITAEQWDDELEQEARMAVEGRCYETGQKLAGRRRQLL
ncbi:MAG: UbiD family decarboxylase [Nitriliruptorales bacterium]|nr:UbiD family decarboxylase [Nitriliruptorales bacterium]